MVFRGDLPPNGQGRVFSLVTLAVGPTDRDRVIDMNFDSGQTTFREYFMPNCGALPRERGESQDEVWSENRI